METYKIARNEAFKSIEIEFDGKPSEAVRDALKSLRFRWHGVKKIWYGYADEEAVRNAIENAETAKAPKAPKDTKKVAKTAPTNEYGVEVGDVFYMNWGWEQTNVDFFQVVALCGKSSVKIRHVSPEIVHTDGEGFMCANYTYNLTKEPMRPDNCGVFIDDNNKGAIKRLQKSGETVYIRIGNHMVSKVPHGLRREYVSWYA